LRDGTTERRSHARFQRTFDVHEIGSEGSTVGQMTARNLSLGGLYCTSARAFDEMTRLAVRLMLPVDGTTEPLDVEAVVVRAREAPSRDGRHRYELALYFTRVDDEQRRRLSLFLGS